MNEVAAVVVTYNRLELLKQCVDHLLNQTVPCDVLIVDNASTDGTGEWLDAPAQKHDGRIRSRNTGSNIGGAGGFNVGMRWAVESEYSHVWIMDDDTLPEPDALEKLLEADALLDGEYGWLSSLSLWKDKQLCIMNIQRSSPYRKICSFDEVVIPAQMASFVSLFVRSNVIKQSGFPIKEFFIWSDDWEYTRRISFEYPCYLITNSIVIHAMQANIGSNIAVAPADRLMRYGYAFRNEAYVYKREGILGVCYFTAKCFWNILRIIFFSKENKGVRISILCASAYEGLFTDITSWKSKR